jgi:hypothetical protein
LESRVLYQQLNVLGPVTVDRGPVVMHGREREFSQIIENFTEEQKINALWFEESLVVNTKELLKLFFSIMMLIL